MQRQASKQSVVKTFTTVKELPITSVKNQHRSGTCWDYATLANFNVFFPELERTVSSIVRTSPTTT